MGGKAFVECEAYDIQSLKSSLPVPSVQELAKEHIQIVPERYIRDSDDDIVAIDHQYPSRNPSIVVPLIDLSKLTADSPQEREVELQKLLLACKDWGAFQLINHGVPNEVVENIKKQAQEFFDLPSEEKKRSAQQPGSLEGYGQAFVASEDQKLEWHDMIFLQTLPDQKRNMSLWPQQLPNFRETLENYSESMTELAVCLKKFMAKALEVDDEEFCQIFQEGNYFVRMNYYPPCSQAERVLGIIPHEDICGITLLLECGDMPGLQVLKDGRWFIIEPIKNAIVVNFGRAFEVLSNGIFKAPTHRAVVNKLKDRLSVVTFCFPNPSAKIGPAQQLIKLGNPPLYKTLTNEEYFDHFFNRKLDDPFIDRLKLQD